MIRHIIVLLFLIFSSSINLSRGTDCPMTDFENTADYTLGDFVLPASSVPAAVPVCVRIEWDGGSWETECSYKVSDGENTLVIDEKGTDSTTMKYSKLAASGKTPHDEVIVNAQSGEFTFELLDTWGDGWNGGKILITSMTGECPTEPAATDFTQDHGELELSSGSAETVTLLVGEAAPTTVPTGTYAPFSCNAGLEIIDSSITTIECNNGVVSTTNVCAGILCPAPAEPRNADPASIKLRDVTGSVQTMVSQAEHSWTYEYTCNVGYRATVTNPNDNDDDRTGVMECYVGLWYANGTNYETMPRRFTWQSNTTVIPYCASTSKTKIVVSPIGLTSLLSFAKSWSQGHDESNLKYYKYYRSHVSGIFKMETKHLRNKMTQIMNGNDYNLRWQYLNKLINGDNKLREGSYFLLKEYGGYYDTGGLMPESSSTDLICNAYNILDDSESSCNNEGDMTIETTVRRTLRDIPISNSKWSRSGSGNRPWSQVFRSFMMSQNDAPLSSTVNVTFTGTTMSGLPKASVAENMVDSHAMKQCLADYTCDYLFFGDYWRDHYMDLVEPVEDQYYLGWDGGDHASGSAAPYGYSSWAKVSLMGLHNPMVGYGRRVEEYKFNINSKWVENTDMEWKVANKVEADAHDWDGNLYSGISDYTDKHRVEGLGKAAEIAFYIDELCHNAWTIEVGATADASWCRENLAVGGVCVAECSAGLKSNAMIPCVDGTVALPDFEITCVPDTCPDSPGPGEIPYGKVNNCVGLQADGICNPLCNEGYIATGSITCPGGNVLNSFQCTPPCGSAVPSTFNHGTNGLGFLKPNSVIPIPGQTTSSNSNECLFMQPGETCTPTCDTGYVLEGEMTCSADAVFTNTAVCVPSCDLSWSAPVNNTRNDCANKILSRGDKCIVRTDVGYSFPDNTKSAFITCDANGNVVRPEDPQPDCMWDTIADGSIGHCLPNLKDTILNVHGQCKPGQIIKTKSDCEKMWQYVDHYELKTGWEFASGNYEALYRNTGVYTYGSAGGTRCSTYSCPRTALGCGLGEKYFSYSDDGFPNKKRSFKDLDYAINNLPNYVYGFGVTYRAYRYFNNHPLSDIVSKVYEELRVDLVNFAYHCNHHYPGGFYETTDPWEQYELIKDVMYWFLSDDSIPVNSYLGTEHPSHCILPGAQSRITKAIKPDWSQDDLDMVRARDYGYPLSGMYPRRVTSDTPSGRQFFLVDDYYMHLSRYGLDGERYLQTSLAETPDVNIGIGHIPPEKDMSNPDWFWSHMGIAGGGTHQSGSTSDWYKYPVVCNAPKQKNFGDTCTPVCDPGYEMIGAAQTCSADGTLSAKPTCQKAQCTEQPTDPLWKDSFANGDVSHCDPIARLFTPDNPTGCVPVCDTGYMQQGSFGCDNKGATLKNNLKCELKCPGLAEAMGNHVFNNAVGTISHCADMNHGETCKLNCPAGQGKDILGIYCMPRFGCSNTCESANDGVCDDGGNNALFGTCDLGTDCADCEARGIDVVNNAICEITFILDDANIINRDTTQRYVTAVEPCQNFTVEGMDTWGDGWNNGGSIEIMATDSYVAGPFTLQPNEDNDFVTKNVYYNIGSFTYTGPQTLKIKRKIKGTWKEENHARLRCADAAGDDGLYTGIWDGDLAFKLIDLSTVAPFSQSVLNTLPGGCTGNEITLSTTCSPNCLDSEGLSDPPGSALVRPFMVVIENGVQTVKNAICAPPCTFLDGSLDAYVGFTGNCPTNLPVTFSEGQSCQPGCQSGYYKVGGIYCDSGLTVNNFTCAPGPCSAQPVLPSNAAIDSTNLLVDSSMEIPCQEGFNSVGMYSCNDNVLSGSAACIRQCMKFPSAPGEKELKLNKGRVGTTACADGYVSEGEFLCENN